METTSEDQSETSVSQPSANTAQKRVADSQSSKLVASPEVSAHIYELRQRAERRARLPRITVEISRVDNDMKLGDYLEFLHRTASRSHENLMDAAGGEFSLDGTGRDSFGATHDPGQPQDGLSSHDEELVRDSPVVTYTALFWQQPQHKPERGGEATSAVGPKSDNETTAQDADGSGGGSENEGAEGDAASNSKAETGEKQRPRRTFWGTLWYLFKVLLLMGLPCWAMMQPACRDPMMRTLQFAWREFISPFFINISPADLFVHDHLILYDALHIPDFTHYEQPVPDEYDQQQAAIHSPFILKPRAVRPEPRAKVNLHPSMLPHQVDEALDDPPADGVVRADDHKTDENAQRQQDKKEVDEPSPTTTTPTTKPAATSPIVAPPIVRPKSIDTAALLARVERLERLIARDMDLVMSYDDMQTDRHPIADTPRGFDLKQLMARRIFPETDPECRWSFMTERCEPARTCSWQYKVGDLWPSRSCRKRPAGPVDDELLEQEGAIRRTFSSMSDRTKVILQKVHSWIPSMPAPLLQAPKQRTA